MNNKENNREKREKFLTSSDLTKPNEEVKEIANSFEGTEKEIIKQIINWIGNLEKKNFKKELFRKRNVREIIGSGCVRSCSDQALVFITLTRLNDIPSKYVYLLEGRRIKEDGSQRSGGHTIARCFLDDEWIYVDPAPDAPFGNFLGEKIDIPFDRWAYWHEGKNWQQFGLDSYEKMVEISRQRPAKAEIEIPDKIFDYAIEKAKQRGIKTARVLRELLNRGLADMNKNKTDRQNES